MKIEQAKQFADKALETLMAALEQGQSETLETYLTTMAKFRRYSWNNVLLIATQKPSATRVAGFHTWGKLGRHVRKGEKGIMILAPIVYRKRTDNHGGEEETENPTGIRGFRAVHVFDLSQTEGEAIAEFATVTGDPKDYAERLAELVRKDGITLEFSELTAPAKGLSKGGTIVLLPDLSPAESCAVLAHELAHERLHKGERRSRTTQCIRETEAEAVAFVVCEAIGLENNGHSADYLRLYDGDRETLEESLHHIQKTAAEIVATAGSLYQRRDSSVWWMSYRDQDGRFRQESTGQRDEAEAEKALRKRLVARDEGLLPNVSRREATTFNEWADWFLANRSKPPFRSEKTHRQNLGALKFLRPRFGKQRPSDITSEDIEAYLMKRLNTGKRVHTKLGLEVRGRLKPATVHQEFRILGRILNVAVKKRRLALNPCNGVEFPVALADTTRKPHYLTSSEQERLEACAPVYLRNIIVIMVEMGLRPYRELIPTRKEHVDIENGVVHLPDSKTANGIADMPMTDRAREAFISQMKESGDSECLFPSPRAGGKKPHITTVRKLWDRTLKRAGLPHFSLYELRHTFATRLNAGGVADHFVTQMLRQGTPRCSSATARRRST